MVRVSYLMANAKAVVTECGAQTEMDADLAQGLCAALERLEQRLLGCRTKWDAQRALMLDATLIVLQFAFFLVLAVLGALRKDRTPFWSWTAPPRATVRIRSSRG